MSEPKLERLSEEELATLERRTGLVRTVDCAGPMTTFPGDNIAHVTTIVRGDWVAFIQWLGDAYGFLPSLLAEVRATRLSAEDVQLLRELHCTYVNDIDLYGGNDDDAATVALLDRLIGRSA